MQPKTETDLIKLQQDIDEQKWRHSNLKGAHEYILHTDNPGLFNTLAEHIRTDSTPRKFKGTTYYYFIFNGYRYWKIAGIINRAKEKPQH